MLVLLLCFHELSYEAQSLSCEVVQSATSLLDKQWPKMDLDTTANYQKNCPVTALDIHHNREEKTYRHFLFMRTLSHISKCLNVISLDIKISKQVPSFR